MYIKKLLYPLLILTLFITNIQAVPSDFNNDGISDILKREGNSNHIWYMNTDGSYVVKDIGTKAKSYRVLGVADFNGDGIADILWRKGSRNYLWYMNADGTHKYKRISSKSYTFAGIGDFNNDGIADILWRKGYKNHLWLMKKDGSHKWKNIGNKSSRYKLIGLGDFNGDGIVDIFWRIGNSNTLWLMNTDGTHKWKYIGKKSTKYSIVGLGDFNGDGIADIFWRIGNSNTLWLMNADGTHKWKYLGKNPSTSKVLETGDYNNDGNIDILWETKDGFVVWLLADDTKVLELRLEISLDNHQSIFATLGANGNLEFNSQTNPNIYQELVLSKPVKNPEQYIEMPLDEFEAHSVKDGAEVTVTAINTDTGNEFPIPASSNLLSAIYNKENPYIHLKGILPNELASYTIKAKFSNDENSSTITSKSFELTPGMNIQNVITTNYTTAKISPSVANIEYVESVTAKIYNLNGQLVASPHFTIDNGEISPFSYNGSAGTYTIETTAQYQGDENPVKVTTGTFTLRSKPVTPPPPGGPTGPTGPGQ